jgi:hypothetical protein
MQLNFSEIELPAEELMILKSFTDNSLRDKEDSFLPLLDLDLLETRYVSEGEGKPSNIPKIAISHRGQLYLNYLAKKRIDRFFQIGTFAIAVFTAIISLILLLRG